MDNDEELARLRQVVEVAAELLDHPSEVQRCAARLALLTALSGDELLRMAAYRWAAARLDEVRGKPD